MMRPLVMDFRTDPTAREITDQYMFGPAFLVSPVTTYQARSRSVYLPPTPGGWYDFWTGAALAGGRTIAAPAPYDATAAPRPGRGDHPVRAGTAVRRAKRRPTRSRLYVYAGANGAFTLYEDDGLTYDYERGAFSRIPFHWDDAAKTLTIGRRVGAFPRMLTERTFNIVLVSKAKPVGFSFTPRD